MLDDLQDQKTRLYAKMTYLLGRDDHSVSLFVHHTQHTGDTGRPNKDDSHRYDTLNLSYTNRLDDRLKLAFKAGYRSYDRRWGEDGASLVPPGLGLREHDGVEQRVLPLEATLTVRQAGDSLLTAGIDGQLASYRTYGEVDGTRSTGNDVQASSGGVFLREKLLLGRWVLRAGARFGLTHHASSSLTFHSNAGSSFVAPSAKSIGGTIKASDLGVPGRDGQLPNPALKPESGLGSDLGVDLKPFPGVTLGLRGFLNEVDDAIVENVVRASPSQTQSVYAGTARSYGAEVSLHHAASSRLEWLANATVTRTSLPNPLDPDQDGTSIPFVPPYVVNAGVTVQLPLGLTASPYLQAGGT